MASRPKFHWFAHLCLISASITFIAPFLWMVSTSFKSETRIFPKAGTPPQWIPTADKLDDQGRRIVRILEGSYAGKQGIEISAHEGDRHEIVVDGDRVALWPEQFEVEQRLGFQWRNYLVALQKMDFVNNLRNTLFICLFCVVGTVISSGLVAYSFARIPWKGRNVVFLCVLATMMIPYQVTLIPLFAVYRSLGWVGSFKPLILPSFFGVPFYIFLLRQFLWVFRKICPPQHV